MPGGLAVRRSGRLLGLVAALAGLGCAGPPAEPPPGESAWARAGREAVARARGPEPPGGARNAILFVGDGMGLSTVTAARILEGQQRGETGEENLLAFERLPHVALLKTYNTDQQTPDSAGSMTALVTGEKTRAGVLGLDAAAARGDHAGAAGHALRTLLEEAEERGLATGIVTTTSVTHATPAATYAHVPERDWESDAQLPEAARRDGFPDIARQLLETPWGDGPEVVLGGGRSAFLPAGRPDPEDPGSAGERLDGRDLVAEWLARPGSAYAWNRAGLAAIDPGAVGRVLGLFGPSHMHFEVDRLGDRGGEPSLAEMTAFALRRLERSPRGFFLMVEGGRIDHAHHGGNAYRALTETIELSRAVEVALGATDPADTLVVVTADHDHTLTLAGYATRGNPVLGLVVENDLRGEPAPESAPDSAGLPYTALGYQNGPGYVAPRPDLGRVDTADPGYRQEASVPLASETHSAHDVPLYAGGPGAALFRGVQEQSYVYHAIAAALGWR